MNARRRRRPSSKGRPVHRDRPKPSVHGGVREGDQGRRASAVEVTAVKAVESSPEAAWPRGLQAARPPPPHHETRPRSLAL
jgi:hypothetical protein